MNALNQSVKYGHHLKATKEDLCNIHPNKNNNELYIYNHLRRFRQLSIILIPQETHSSFYKEFLKVCILFI